MENKTCGQTRHLRRWLTRWAVVVAVVAAFQAGRCVSPERPAYAEPRAVTDRGHFLSGGERAVAVLQEAVEILRRIDGRLERIEKAALAKP